MKTYRLEYEVWRFVGIISILVLTAQIGNGCSGVVRDTDADTDQETEAGPDGVCGGFFGLRCPPGLICVDVPDGCDPWRGDMDCIGGCLEEVPDLCAEWSWLDHESCSADLCGDVEDGDYMCRMGECWCCDDESCWPS